MSSIAVRYEACVRSLSMAAACEACKEACPEGAITLDGPRETTVVHLDRCTDCALCAAACPTNAIEAPFELGTLVAGISETLRCGDEGLPCVGALSTEDLLQIATRHRHLDVHDGPCAARDPGHHHAARRVEEAQRVAEALGLKATLTWHADPSLAEPAPVAPDKAPPAAAPERVSTGRRQLLRMLVPPLESRPSKTLTIPDRLDRTRMQQLPDRRRRLLAALPPSVEARTETLPAAEVGFFSSKTLSAEACTACSICVSVCPTGALQAPRSFREIRFDTSRCTKCGLCHDVCEPHAIELADDASLVDFLDFAPRMLSRLPVAACGECGASFRRARPDQGLCPRCEDLEQEAMELSGVRR